MENQLQPHSLEAEEGLIASCLIDGGTDVVTKCVAKNVTADSFFIARHRILFAAILELYNDGKAIDEILLLELLKKNQQEDSVGGIAGIYAIQDRVETNLQSSEFISIVSEKFKLRQIIRTSREAIERAQEGQESGDIISQMDKGAQNIVETGSADFDIVSGLEEASKRLTEVNYETVIPFGIPSYDESFADGGMKAGEVHVIGARPGRAKTALALNIAGRTLRDGIGVGVFALEMSSVSLLMRMICMKSGLNLSKFKDNLQTREEQDKFDKAKAEMSKWNLQIDDSSFMTVAKIKAKARMWKRKHNIGLIVIDYLQLVSTTDSKANREQQVADISRNLKCLAKELEVPVLLLAQIGRQVENENRQPRLTDLRESGSIEQDASAVTFLYTLQEDIGPDGRFNQLRWVRPKQREGEPGRFGKFTFIGKLGIIRD